MKTANLLFDILYFIGLGLAFAAFYTFIPEVDRTQVAWLNFGIGLVIYTGYLGRLVTLFRPIVKFSDNVPFFAAYWVWWGIYVLLAIAGMIGFHYLELTFRKQALLQGIIFFLFINVIVFGMWGAAWMARSSARDQRTIGGVRNIQYLASSLKGVAAGLPITFVANKLEIDKIFEDISCIVGSENAEAIALDEKISSLITRASHGILNDMTEDDLTKITKELRVAVAMRKAI